MRLDPKAAKDAGEDLSGDEEARPWISEMCVLKRLPDVGWQGYPSANTLLWCGAALARTIPPLPPQFLCRYGYSFAAARAGVSHIVTDTFQYRITSPEVGRGIQGRWLHWGVHWGAVLGVALGAAS